MNQEKKIEALEFARSASQASLATVEGDIPHVRIMEIAKIEEDFSIWFSTSACSNKIRQVTENPNACVVIYQGSTDLKILGKAVVVTDKKLKDSLYKDKWDVHYPNGGSDDPDYAVIKIISEKAEYRDMKKYGLAPENLI